MMFAFLTELRTTLFVGRFQNQENDDASNQDLTDAALHSAETQFSDLHHKFMEVDVHFCVVTEIYYE